MDLFGAITLRRTGIVRAMLHENPRLLHKHSPEGWAPLHITSRYADTEMMALFLSAGADVNDNVNKKRLTPLFFATKEPYANAELFLATGAEIDARSKHGFTVLHYAAKSGNENYVAFLLARGARTDLQTEARQTAWALAVRHWHESIVALLNSSQTGFPETEIASDKSRVVTMCL